MKKIFTIIIALIIILSLTACNDKGLIKEEKIQNITITQKFNDGINYVIKRDGTKLLYTKDETSTSYQLAETQVYKYITKTKTIKSDDYTTKDIDETETIEYVQSATDDTTNLLEKFDALLNIKKSDLTKKEKDIYSFNELTKNEFLIPYVDGDLLISANTKLEDAYKTGLLSFDSAEIKISNGCPCYIKAYVTYSSKTSVVEITFSDCGSTEANILKEKTSEDDFNNTITYLDYLEDDAAVITLDFKGYGKVKLKFFNDKADINTINYFVYLLRKGAYSKTYCDSVSTNSIMFGNTTKEEGLKKTIDMPKKSTVANKRGVLSMPLVVDSIKTQQLVLNFSDNSSTSDSIPYIAIAGVVSGFDVLDLLQGMDSEKVTEVKVNVSVEYNSYSYVKPELK